MGKSQKVDKNATEKKHKDIPQIEKNITKQKPQNGEKNAQNGKKKEKAQKKSVKFNLEDNQEFEIESRAKKQKQQNNQSDEIDREIKTNAINSTQNERGWNQKIDDKQTGKFTDDEISLLKESMCKYAFEKGLGESGLIKLVSEKATKETLGAWTQIAEVLPYRSVQSCHNFCRRRFNPNNYGGKWTPEETSQLLALVREHGRKWKLIGQQLGRTETNVRDKYKSLGEDNAEQRKIDYWSLDELVQLIKLISQHTGLKLLKNKKEMKQEIKLHGQKISEESEEFNISRQRVRDIQHVDPSVKFLLNFISFKNLKELESHSIPWTKISNEMKQRSKDDCKNKWTQSLIKIFYEYSGNFEQEEEEDLVQQIYDQEIDSESEIDFSKIQNGKTPLENKMKWNILKKRVTSRQNVTVPSVLKELMSQFTQTKTQSVSENILNNSSTELINYFKSNYEN
ncbi:hypothetical protein ABPG74_008517 [Tetrahymena malaccensis]